MDETNALKAISRTDDELRVGNHIILFGGRDLAAFALGEKTPMRVNRDGSLGEYFTEKTVIESEYTKSNKIPVDWEHGLISEEMTRGDALGWVDWSTKRITDKGVFVERVLNRREQYVKWLEELIDAGLIGTSSEADPQTVRKTASGEITHWGIRRDTLTVIPCEPRMLSANQLQAVKSLNIKIELESVETESSTQATDEAAAETDASGADVANVETQEENTQTDAGTIPANEVNEMADEQNTAPQANELDAVKKELAELKAKVDAPPTNAGAPAIKTVTERGFKDDEMKSFLHYIKTGDATAYKAAMQGQTDSEGGYAVPDDFYNQVVAKRNEVSVMRMAGVQVMQTSLDRLLVPVEDTAATKFVVTAEEGAYSENEPTLNQVAITVHKLTKLIKISEELEADAKANFGSYLAGVWGRTLGLAENYYFCNVAANGSSQPQSVTYASTATTAVASQTATTAAELLALIYTVPSAYSDNLVMLMRRATLGAFRALSGNPFSFIPTPDGAGNANTAGGMAGTIHGIPVYCTDDLPAQAAANKPIVIFNPNFYMIVEREGLNVSRNPYLYQANGQIGLFARARMGGALLQADAAYHLLSKT